ncbi:MAG: hypothetical protein MUC87_05685 [Bacteroidia bacterium]|jgi:hypothetical protein|nr:hypothetical protein [Bacteroidia bacterium]
MPSIWTEPTTHSGTILFAMSKSIQEFSEQYKSVLPNLKTAQNLMCFSDYSGEEEQSKHFVYSFLIINGDKIKKWNLNRLKLRKEFLSDGRRISYKNYRDKLTQKFVDRYLNIVDELEGYIITISVSKDLPTLFDDQASFIFTNPQFDKYSEWSKGTIEKSFRIMHFLSLLISGFSKEYQNLLWITDNDNIAANKDRLKQLTELFAATASQYLNHSLGHLRVATTNSDDRTRSIEDLCAIPDLVAGAYSDQLKTVGDIYHQTPNDIFWMYSPQYQKKTKDLTWWLTTSNKKLCKLFFKINKGVEKNQSVSFYHFYNRG